MYNKKSKQRIRKGDGKEEMGNEKMGNEKARGIRKGNGKKEEIQNE